MSLAELAAAGRGAGRPGSQSMVSPGFSNALYAAPAQPSPKAPSGRPFTLGADGMASASMEQGAAGGLRQGQDMGSAVRSAVPAHDRYGGTQVDAAQHRYGSSSEPDSVASTPRSMAEASGQGGRPPSAGLAVDAEMRMSRDNPMLTPQPSVSSSLQLTSSAYASGSIEWSTASPMASSAPLAGDASGAAMQDGASPLQGSPLASMDAGTPLATTAGSTGGSTAGALEGVGQALAEGERGGAAVREAEASLVGSFEGDVAEMDYVVRADGDEAVTIDPKLPAAMRKALHQALDVIARAEALERTIAVPDDSDDDDDDEERRAARKEAQAAAEASSAGASDGPSDGFTRSAPLSSEESSVAAVAAAAAYIRKGKGKLVEDVGESSVLMSSVESLAGGSGASLAAADSVPSFAGGAGPSSLAGPALDASASSGVFSMSMGPVDAGASFDSDIGNRRSVEALGGAFGQLDDVAKALLAAEHNQEMRRRELAKYMEALQSLRDDEGEEVVEFPADFEQQIWALAGKDKDDRSATATAEPPEEEVIFYKPDGTRDTEKEEGIKKIRKLDRILAQKMKKALAVAKEVYPDKYAKLAEKSAAAAEQALREERKQAKLEARLQRIMEGVDAAKPPGELSIVERNKMMGANARYFMLQPEEEALVERLLASPDIDPAEASGEAAEVVATGGVTGFEVAGDDRRRIEEIEARLARFQLAHATEGGALSFTPRPGSSAESTTGSQGGGDTDRTGTAAGSVRGDRRPTSATSSVKGAPASVVGGLPGKGGRGAGAVRDKAAGGAVSARGGAGGAVAAPEDPAQMASALARSTVDDYLTAQREEKEAAARQEEVDARLRAVVTAELQKPSPEVLRQLIEECKRQQAIIAAYEQEQAEHSQGGGTGAGQPIDLQGRPEDGTSGSGHPLQEAFERPASESKIPRPVPKTGAGPPTASTGGMAKADKRPARAAGSSIPAPTSGSK
eukprot:jgi/Mesvir1/8144/Mv25070-RA.4